MNKTDKAEVASGNRTHPYWEPTKEQMASEMREIDKRAVKGDDFSKGYISPAQYSEESHALAVIGAIKRTQHSMNQKTDNQTAPGIAREIDKQAQHSPQAIESDNARLAKAIWGEDSEQYKSMAVTDEIDAIIEQRNRYKAHADALADAGSNMADALEEYLFVTASPDNYSNAKAALDAYNKALAAYQKARQQ